MYLHRYGDGPKLYLGIHGWAADHTTFASLASLMPPDCTILAVDLPGYGNSAPPQRWDWSALSADLHQTLHDAIQDQPFSLIGSCSGAIMGLGALEHTTLNLQRLILLEPFAYVPAYLNLFLWPAFGPVAYWSTFANPIGRLITDRATSSRQATAADTTQQSFAKVDPWVPYKYLAMMKALGSAQRFAHLNLPTHLIFGQKTFQAVKSSITTWRALWPHATATELPELGHMLVQEDPQRVASHIFTQE